MKTKILQLVKELSEEGGVVEEQFKKFHKKTKMSRATFFRYRDELGLREHNKAFTYLGKVNHGNCYFCLNKTQVIHHIDGDRKNNYADNLIPLCNGCHNKIHRLMKRLGDD